MNDETNQLAHFFTLTEQEFFDVSMGRKKEKEAIANSENKLTLDSYWDGLSYTLIMKFPKAEFLKWYVFPVTDNTKLETWKLKKAFVINFTIAKQVSEFLQTIDRARLRKSYRFNTMQSLGVHIPQEDDEEVFFERLYNMVEELKEFYHTASTQEKYVIMYLTRKNPKGIFSSLFRKK